MKTRFLIISLFLSIASFCFAQNASIEFAERVYDFGQIKEEGGRVQTTFEFTNTGTQPVTLTNVQASCGCTTPEWSREPIAPNKKGFINVTYNPSGRPGNFNKSITVRYTEAGNEATQSVMLNIKGEVIPKPRPENK